MQCHDDVMRAHSYKPENVLKHGNICRGGTKAKGYCSTSILHCLFVWLYIVFHLNPAFLLNFITHCCGFVVNWGLLLWRIYIWSFQCTSEKALVQHTLSRLKKEAYSLLGSTLYLITCISCYSIFSTVNRGIAHTSARVVTIFTPPAPTAVA